MVTKHVLTSMMKEMFKYFPLTKITNFNQLVGNFLRCESFFSVERDTDLLFAVFSGLS